MNLPLETDVQIPGLVVLAILLTAQLGSSQPTSLPDSYRRAKTLLDAAVEAHGGREGLTRATRLSARMEGRDHWRNQSRAVSAPYDTEPWLAELILDTPARRLVWTVSSRFPGGFFNASRVVIDGASGFNANLRQGTHFTVANRALETQRPNLFRLPHLVLLAVLDNPGELRWLGPMTTRSGRPVEAIVAPTTPGSLTLGFDPATKELRAILGMTTDPLLGDTGTEVTFTDYRRVGGILIPGRRTASTGGEVTQEVEYREVGFEPVFADSLLQPPAQSVTLGTPPAAVPVRELAPGVWAVDPGGYVSLVVAFDQFVLATEAPGQSAAIIERIKTLAPGKPIQWVVPSHHHDDHAGGAREYVAEGATILTTPGNVGYFRQMAAASRTIRPDRQSRVRAPAKIETVTGGRRTISDGTRIVEVHDIGPSPHANEMLVIWLPAEGILYQGDLLNLPPTGEVPRNAANATSAHFAQQVAAKGWTVKMLLGAHMQPGDFGLLGRALANRSDP